MRRPPIPLLLAGLLLGACAPARPGSDPGDDSDMASATGPGPKDPPPPPVPQAVLTGQVLAPEGTIPIAGALIYASARAPDALPGKLACDRCVKITDGTPYATSAPDGRFSLPVPIRNRYYLVVQKGAFRRVRTIDVGDVANTTIAVPAAQTTLPGKSDPAAGDDIPRMAVVAGQWDKIEVTLAKLGLGKLKLLGVDKASLAFDLYGDGLPFDPKFKDPAKLLRDPALLAQYQVLFLPCSGSSGTTCTDTSSTDPKLQKPLQDFVAQGGKLYVTDYSYEYIRQLWPGYISWEDETAKVGSACQSQSYDAPATVGDAGMKDWLKAQGINDFSLQDNWTTIQKVSTVATTDLDGKPAMVTPKVWVAGMTPSGQRPMTMSFVRGCGRVLYSTYHTEAELAGNNLLPQEKALLYVLLETQVCVQPPVLGARGETPPPER